MASIKASKKHGPAKRALKKKGPARTKFTSVKSNLNSIDSWDLGNILLEPFFASSADDENGELLLSVLKKAAWNIELNNNNTKDRKEKNGPE